MNNESKKIFIDIINSFNDNYIWVLKNNRNDCCIVDPGESDIVIEYLKKNNLSVRSIMLTHHHKDHSGGIKKILSINRIKVYAFQTSKVDCVTHKVEDDQVINILGEDFVVLYTPGHTLDHIAFYSEKLKIVFTGDCLFSAGCGRLFEGNAVQMVSSLNKLQSLPNDTTVYCAHEYTVNNLLFAGMLEPNNAIIREELLNSRNKLLKYKTTIPTTIEKEKKINPFFKIKNKMFVNSLMKRYPSLIKNSFTTEDIFLIIRRLKDIF